jgi:pimeloyl-ACP methyl ester carboxylesterase
MKDPELVDVRGQRLRVAVRPGDPRRTPLLLCNGIGVGFEAFDAFVDALDPRIPVIRFDPPGAGGSPLPFTPYRLPGLARAVMELVDLLDSPGVAPWRSRSPSPGAAAAAGLSSWQPAPAH